MGTLPVFPPFPVPALPLSDLLADTGRCWPGCGNMELDMTRPLLKFETQRQKNKLPSVIT